MNNDHTNPIRAQHQASQAREDLIRALANDDIVHGLSGGIVENITPDIVAQSLISGAMSNGLSPMDAMKQVAIADPVALAGSLRLYLWDMMCEYGTQGNDGMGHLDLRDVA